jgi:hypothetical protein
MAKGNRTRHPKTLRNRQKHLIQSRHQQMPQVEPVRLQRAMARPSQASPAELLALQQTAGNRAVTGLLSNPTSNRNLSPPPQPGKSAIQRFSETDTEPNATVNWDNETDHITKSSAGQMGGVFFFHDANGHTLVLKPEYNDVERKTMAGQTQFADKFLQGMGFNTPQSRIIEPGNDEFAKVVRLIPEKLTFSDKVRTEIGDLDAFKTGLSNRLAGVKYFKLMQSASGDSMAGMLKDATTIDAVSQVIQTLSNPHLLRQLGRLVVADAVLGNNDRLGIETSHRGTTFVSNLGNIVISGNQLTTIDSDALARTALKSVHNHNFNALSFHSLIDSAIDDAPGIFDKVLEVFQQGLQDKVEGSEDLTDRMAGSVNLTQYFSANYDAGAASPLFQGGVKAGLDEVMEILTQQPEQLEALEAEAQKTYGSDPQNKDSVWDTFMARGHYLKSRYQGGKKIETALQEGMAYQFYQQVWSKQLPVQLPPLHPLIQDQAFSYPSKSMISKKGSGREEANALKLKYTKYMANIPNVIPTRDMLTVVDDFNKVTGDSDSAKKARFFVKSTLLYGDIREKHTDAVLKPLANELKALGLVERNNLEIVAAAKQRQTRLENEGIPMMQQWKTDYQNMIDKVNAILEKKSMRKLGLDQFKEKLPNALDDLSEKITLLQADLQTASVRLGAINPRGWRRRD